MCSCTTNMRYAKIFLAAGLCAATWACRSKTLTRLEPTIEDTRPLASSVRLSEQPRGEQLVKGFYDLQGGVWRWAAPQFEVLLGTPAGAQARGANLVLEFSLPDPSIAGLKDITVAGQINHVALKPETYSSSGAHEYRRETPPAAFLGPDTLVEFTVDKFLTPTGDGRNLALVVTAISLEPK
jgi:hypothetical protein